MFSPANTPLIIARQRRNAERLCAPESPGLAIFAAYFALVSRTIAARIAKNAIRTRCGLAACAVATRLPSSLGNDSTFTTAPPCGQKSRDDGPAPAGGQPEHLFL